MQIKRQVKLQILRPLRFFSGFFREQPPLPPDMPRHPARHQKQRANRNEKPNHQPTHQHS